MICIACGDKIAQRDAVEGIDGTFSCWPCAHWHND